MEAELLKKIEDSINIAETSYGRGDYRMAFLNYFEALTLMGSYVVYRELGLLYPPEAAMGVLEARHPALHGVILHYQRYGLSISSVTREVVEEMRDEVLELYKEIKR